MAVEIRFQKMFCLGIGMVEIDPQSCTIRPTTRRTGDRLGLNATEEGDSDASTQCRRRVTALVEAEYGHLPRGWLWIRHDAWLEVKAYRPPASQ